MKKNEKGSALPGKPSSVAVSGGRPGTAGGRPEGSGGRGRFGPATGRIAGLLAAAALAQCWVVATLAGAASGSGFYGLLLSLEGIGSFLGLALLGAAAFPAARKVMLRAWATPPPVRPLALAPRRGRAPPPARGDRAGVPRTLAVDFGKSTPWPSSQGCLASPRRG